MEKRTLLKLRKKLASQKSDRKGLTLIELAIVLLVLGIIIGIVFANLDFSLPDKAKALSIRTASTQLAMQLERYEFSNPPLEEGDQLSVLAERNPDNPSWKPLKQEAVKDPWGNPYFICRDEYDTLQICSNGADGKPGGEDQASDFVLTDENTWPAWISGELSQ